MTGPGLPKLIATDLDGTLVRRDETVSAFTHRVLARVREAGITLVGATGRGPRLTQLVRTDIPSATHLVLGGGSRVVDLTDPAGPVTLTDHRLTGEAVAAVLAAVERRVGRLSVLMECDDTDGAPLLGDPDPVWRYDPVEWRARADLLTGTVLKAMIRHPDHDADALLAIAAAVVPPELACLTQSGLGFVEIGPPGVDKATGLARVAESLGIDPRDAMVFGDMPNDVPMFRWAGFARIAVGNAHPEVLALASETTLPNDADGVAVYLDRLLPSR